MVFAYMIKGALKLVFNKYTGCVALGALLSSGIAPGKESDPSIVTDKKGYHYFQDTDRKVVTDPSGTYIYNKETESIEIRLSNHQKESGLVGKINN